MNSASGKLLGLTGTQWLICTIASIGFAFDIYELLMLPLIIKPAILSLGGYAPGTAEYIFWARLLFFVPAVAGGIFGMVGGYLTDRLGRRRVLTWSIFLYAFSALAAGFTTSLEMLLFFRCLVFIGVCVEFVAAVAWIAELFSEPAQREKVLAYTQAFSSLGGLMVTAMYGLIVYALKEFPEVLPAIQGKQEAWRYTLVSGVIPAIPLMVIRPFLPESPVWVQKRAKGGLKRASFLELFRPEYRKATIVTAVLFACGYGAAFGAIQHLPQIVPYLPEVKNLPQLDKESVIANVQFWQEIGGLTGRFVLALLILRIASRQTLLRTFQIPGLILLPLVFIFPATENLHLLQWGIFLVALCTVGQFSFWGNYLPRMYPTHLRGTGESFAANVGGRIIGTSFAFITLTLSGSDWMKGMFPNHSLAYSAALIGGLVYLVGLGVSFLLPEPKQAELPE